MFNLGSVVDIINFIPSFVINEETGIRILPSTLITYTKAL